MAEVGTRMAIKDYNDAYVCCDVAGNSVRSLLPLWPATLRRVFYSALWARLRAGIDKGSSRT